MHLLSARINSFSVSVSENVLKIDAAAKGFSSLSTVFRPSSSEILLELTIETFGLSYLQAVLWLPSIELQVH